ncbi:unnamed protein product [Hyaloperonospora brassicae]|uniref:Uncharacterized protein n=1 Tax=Hyaloperonospora brassicae TaxID=162125 RepID=A0AAV0SXJ7_HYABA|nr:unnamed protein product [Hyaloperonospora brassicae]
MATTAGDATLAPHEEPATKTPSSGARNADTTKKRLLPMELRKQRRAAKLQVIDEQKTRMHVDSLQTATRSTNDSLTPAKKARAEAESGSDVHVDSATSIAAASVELPSAAANTSCRSTCAEKKASRLDSLYASSFVGRKSRQLRPGASVPHFFHVADLPRDVVPKTKVSILTAFPYPFARVNSQLKKRALERFVTGRANSAAPSASHPSNVMRWQQALHYFAHPADALPTYMLLRRASGASSPDLLPRGLNGKRQQEETTFFAARWNTWQEAFRDVYMNFRRQERRASHDCSFYLRSSDFVVYFQHERSREGATNGDEGTPSIISLCRQHGAEDVSIGNEAGTQRTKKNLCAVMSRSSGRLRKVLHHLNVAYTMPYANATETQREVGEFHMLAEEHAANCSRSTRDSEDTTVAPITRATAVETVRGADSLLLFHGHDAVHGLYEFLINQAPMPSQDVPELYALHPFVHASIQSLQVTSYGPVGRASNSSSSCKDQSSSPSTLFRTEVSGFCFPSSIAQLLTVLKDEWEATQPLCDPVVSHADAGPERGTSAAMQIALRTYMEAVGGTERLNAVQLTREQVATTHDRQQHGREQQQRELEFSKRRLEAVTLKTMESRYDLETSARAIVARRWDA